MEKTGHEGKKHKKGKPIVIVPKKISDWARESSTNAWMFNYKRGGGKPGR